jgi:hypothetical protein
MPFTDALRDLARQMYGPSGPDVPPREQLEAMLVPMIRCALRSGRGAPPLVQWVRRNLPAVAAMSPTGRGSDPEWVAPTMARLLSGRLLGRSRPDFTPAAETVVDR